MNTLEYPFPRREVEFNRQGVQLAWDYARSHPAREVELSLRKVDRLWRSDDDAVLWQELNIPRYLGGAERGFLKGVSNAVYYLALGLSAVGLLVAEPRARGWRLLLLLLVAGWTAFHVLIFSENRLHYPLSPLLSLAAAAGLVAVGRSLKERLEMVRKVLPATAGSSKPRAARRRAARG